MSSLTHSAQDYWRTRTTFVLALSASAVGLGNLWRFSYLTGEYGGAPFVISYVVCLFAVAVPVLVAEVLLGRHGQGDPLSSLRKAADRSLRSRAWVGLGVFVCLTGLLLLSLYCVVAGWALAYTGFMQAGVFSAASLAEVGQHFDYFLANGTTQVYWQSVFLILTAAVVVLGVRRGLGLLVWIAVPLLIAMLGYLVRFGMDYGDLTATREFLFRTRLVDFNAQAVLVALGHAFYTLGVGVGTGICYGAYAHRRVPIGRSVMAVAVFDLVIAVMAGLAIFPIVFANNMEPASGPGLLFVSLPYAFGNIGQGELFGAVFFMLVALAALGSAVAILEPAVAALKHAARLERLTAVVMVGALVWLLSLAVVSSLQADLGPKWFGGYNLFSEIDRLLTRVLLPVAALLTAIFVGWQMRRQIQRAELDRESAWFFRYWRLFLRYIAPPAIVLLLLAPLLTSG
ncbi:MAG: sodium-dependent transporter [Pseudomonadota bacterium]